MKTIQAVPVNNETEFEVDRYSYNDIEQEFGIKSSARRERIIAADITPHREGKTPWIDAEQMEVLRRQNKYLMTPGTTLESYRQSIGLNSSSSSIENTLAVAEPLPKVEFCEWDEFMRNSRDEILMNPRLKAYATFETYHLLNKTISDREIIDIMDWKPPRTGFKESCYQFYFWGYSHYPVAEQVEQKDGSWKEVTKLVKQKLWKIKKIDLEQENRLKLEAKKRKRLEARKKQEQDHEDKANQNYNAVKLMMSD